jgi:hypothetical protein
MDWIESEPFGFGCPDFADVRGSWPKNVKDLIEGSKKINPEMVPMRLPDLRDTTAGIIELIDDLKRLRSSAVA